MNAPHEDAQTVTEATGDAETSAGAEGGRDDLRALREPIAQAIWDADGDDDAATEAVLAVISEAALDRMADQLMEETKLKALDFRNGVHMDIEPARELAAIWVAAARTMLGDAENYSVTKVEFDVGLAVDRENPKPKEMYTLVVQRAGGLTPHEARQRAEAERDQALVDLETAKGWRDAVIVERDLLRREAADYRRANTSFQEINTIRTKERDELNATIAKVRALHAPHKLGHCIGCGMAEAYPCATTALLDGTEHERLTLLRRVAALDQGHDDLPAVREFAADFDPRGEPPCPTT